MELVRGGISWTLKSVNVSSFVICDGALSINRMIFLFLIGKNEILEVEVFLFQLVRHLHGFVQICTSFLEEHARHPSLFVGNIDKFMCLT